MRPQRPVAIAGLPEASMVYGCDRPRARRLVPHVLAGFPMARATEAAHGFGSRTPDARRPARIGAVTTSPRFIDVDAVAKELAISRG
jgi:hypothetical protein